MLPRQFKHSYMLFELSYSIYGSKVIAALIVVCAPVSNWQQMFAVADDPALYPLL